MNWPMVQVRHVAHLEYGTSLPAADRTEGDVTVFGSNGPVGHHNSHNTRSPVVVVGRKGSYGKLQYSSRPVFAIDTTYFIDPACTQAHIKWLYYALSTLHLDETGQDVGVPGLSREYAYSQRVPLPPLEGQRMIADWLDIETGRIDALVSKKQRMIRLLGERRMSLVESSLSRFQPLPLKRYVTKIGSGSTPRGGADVYVPTGPAFLRSQNVKSGAIDLSDVVFIDLAAQKELRRALVYPGDVLLNITGASIGRAAVFDCSEIQAYVSQHVCIVRPRPGVDASVLCAELLSHSVHEQIAVNQVGGNREGLNFEQVGQLLVRVPPVDHSHAIAQELAAGFSRSMRAREVLQAQINLLQERRQALITAAVTGQLAIPGVAA